MKIESLKNISESTVSHNAKIKKRVMLDNNQINHITSFSQAIFPPGECAPAHSHADMTEVFFINSGSGTIKVNGKNFQIEQGMCITVEPNELHELKNTGNEDLIVIYFGVVA